MESVLISAIFMLWHSIPLLSFSWRPSLWRVFCKQGRVYGGFFVALEFVGRRHCFHSCRRRWYETFAFVEPFASDFFAMLAYEFWPLIMPSFRMSLLPLIVCCACVVDNSQCHYLHSCCRCHRFHSCRQHWYEPFSSILSWFFEETCPNTTISWCI